MSRQQKLQIKEIGFQYEQETKRSANIWILSLYVLWYPVIGLFLFDQISIWMFSVAAFVLKIPIFNLAHDKIHTNQNERLPLVLDIIGDWITTPGVPWEDTYVSYRQKHLKHHSSHTRQEDGIGLTTQDDPHIIFEKGGVFSCLFASFFSDEFMLIHDLRNKSFHRSRYIQIVGMSIILFGLVWIFGWQKVLIVCISQRLTNFYGWFHFSYVLHHPWVYEYGFERKLPKVFHLFTRTLLGRRLWHAITFHKAHHKFMLVPNAELAMLSRKLDSFDRAAILGN